MSEEKMMGMSASELYNSLQSQIDVSGRAGSVLDNQCCRQLSEASWQQVNQLLSEPAAPTQALQALMRRNKDDC